MSIIPLKYSFVKSEMIRKGKDTTVRSEEKAELAFAPISEKSSRLFLLDKIGFPEFKAESALGPILGKPSRLLPTRFSNILLFYPLNYFWTLYFNTHCPTIFVILW